jgi:hypothetical protein
MRQAWINVIGLGLDFFGFCLLLREWWLAVFNEDLQIKMEESLEKSRAMRHLTRAHKDPAERNPYAELERMQDEQAIRKARAAHRGALGARKAVFVAASLLIVSGFVLQLVAAVPGCCEPWIVPQSF